jgi:polyisoprenoid-binding protein YceI
MKSKFICLAVGAVFAVSANAADTYTADVSHTFPNFEVSHLGFSTLRGRFNKTTAKITVDKAAQSGSVEATIDAASLDTGWPKRDEHLRSGDFFNVAKFPTLTFKSDSFKFDGDKLVSVPGQLTMLGVTKPVTLQVTNFKCAPHPMLKRENCGAEVSTVIKRSDFGMNYGLPAVGDDIKIAVELEALKDS